MKQQLRLTFIIGLFAFSPLSGSAQEDFRMIGYLPFYRFNLIDDIDFSQLTHVCLAFAHPDERGVIRMEGGDVATAVRKLKQYDVKLLLSLAGGGMSSHRSRIWTHWMSPAQRDKLVQSIISYVRQYGMDGVDVDLEWKDVNRYYSDFILVLSRELKKEGLLLSAAWPGIHRYPNLTDAALNEFDFINIMAYDLTGPWNPDKPGQHSSYEFAEDCITFWRSQGVPAQKLNLGLPFYGYNFSDLENVYSVHFKEMVALDPSFADSDRLGDIYYNGRKLIQVKTELAMQETGGVMFWELGQDATNEHSLLRTSYLTAIGRDPDGVLAYQEALSPLPGRQPLVIEVQEKDKTRYYLSLEKGRLLVIQEDAVSGRTRLKLPRSHRFLEVVHVILANPGLLTGQLRPEFSVSGS